MVTLYICKFEPNKGLPGIANSYRIAIDNPVPNKLLNKPNNRYNVPISLWLVAQTYLYIHESNFIVVNRIFVIKIQSRAYEQQDSNLYNKLLRLVSCP